MTQAVTLYDFESNNEVKFFDVQSPLATDGDSIYVKDINLETSDIGDFSGSISDLFNSLLTITHNTTSDPIKSIKVLFNRSLQTSAIGFGCNDLAHTFSNIVVKALGSGEEVRYTEDQSADDTKRNSYVIDLPPVAANGFIFEFHSTDNICLSNLIIWKSVNVNSRIAGVRPDGKVGDVNVTTDNNLRITDAESGLAIAKGDVTNTTFIHKFGKAPNFDSGDGFVTVWDGSDDSNLAIMDYVYSTSPIIDSLSCGGTDTTTIQVQGLDSDYKIVLQEKALTGQTRVALDTSLIRVFRLKNVGSVDLSSDCYCFENTALSSGVPIDTSKVRAQIHSDNNQTLMAIFTIPAGAVGYLRDWYASTAGAKKDTAHEIKLFARPFGQVFQLKHDANIVSDGTSYIQHVYVEPEVFPEKTDIEMKVNTGQDGAGVSGGFDIVIVGATDAL